VREGVGDEFLCLKIIFTQSQKATVINVAFRACVKNKNQLALATFRRREFTFVLKLKALLFPMA
jgi:hypothetical protein